MSARSVRRLALSALALLLVSAPLAGQDRRPRRPGGQDRQEMEQRARAQMGRMIRQELGLTEAEYAPVAEVMDGYLEERRALWRSEREVRREVEALLSSGASESGAADLLERLADLRRREAAIFRGEQEALLQHLTPTQVLQLQALRERIARRIRDLRGRRGRGGGIGGDLTFGPTWNDGWVPGVDLAGRPPIG